MTLLRLLAPVVAVLVACGSLRAEDSIDDMVRKGLLALDRGDLVTAETLGLQVLRKAPGHVPARDLVARTQDAKKARHKGSAQTDLAKTVLDQVAFEKTSLTDAVEFVRQQLRAKQVNVNIIILDPQDKIRNAIIQELKLKGVPAGQVLAYIAEEVSARVVYREAVVELRPKE